MRAMIIACALAVGLLLACDSAKASWMTPTGMGPNEVVTTHIAGLLADGLQVYDGPEMLTYNGQVYAGYCVDLNHYAGATEVTEVSPLTLTNGLKVSYLLETYGGSATTNLSAAALQTAIWEVISEPAGGPFDATSGTFSISGNAEVAAAANALLATIPALYTPLGCPTVLHSDTAQSFVIDLPGHIPVPEPATMGLLTVGGMFLSRAGRRRRAD